MRSASCDGENKKRKQIYISLSHVARLRILFDWNHFEFLPIAACFFCRYNSLSFFHSSVKFDKAIKNELWLESLSMTAARG